MDLMNKPTQDLTVKDALVVSVLTVALTATVTAVTTVGISAAKNALEKRMVKKIKEASEEV